jgi:hypothetical protein
VAKKRCRDREPPRSSIRHSAPDAAARGHFSGRSIDFGCKGGPRRRSRAGRVKEVLVTFARGRHVCRDDPVEYPSDGRNFPGPRRVCRPFRAKLGKRRPDGKVTWRLHVRFGKDWRRGHYTARVIGCDAARNCETKVRRTNRAGFDLR